MNYAEFQAELKGAGISCREFARLLRLNPNSITNYKQTGVVPSHLAVIAALLRTMHEHGIDHRPVFARIPIAPKAPRGRALMFGRSKSLHEKQYE